MDGALRISMRPKAAHGTPAEGVANRWLNPEPLVSLVKLCHVSHGLTLSGALSSMGCVAIGPVKSLSCSPSAYCLPGEQEKVNKWRYVARNLHIIVHQKS